MGILNKINKEIYLRTASKKLEESEVRDPKKVAVKRLGQAIKGGGSGDFEDSPVDLEEIGRAYYTDSYIRRAVDKHSALMFKNGWRLSGKNDQAVEYVWTRLKLMSEATGTSMESFFQEVADNLVLYGNSYIVKARSKNSFPAGIDATGYTGKQPIAGYFVLPPHQITISRDETGKILGYQQEGSGGEPVEFKPEDVVHFAYRRPSGRAYGVPFVFNTLDDVRLLRQIEENVARLIYRNLFPLHLYKVGLDKPGFEATDEEIEELRDELRDLPVDGALVVPERHNVEVVGSGGEAIDANGYLRYFRQRVFAGLGVSDTIMGISDTANKSTSDNQSADLNDTVKDFQRLFSDVMKFSVINELLFEGGYDPILNEEDEVNFKFSEIEFDAKIKRDNHVIQLYLTNGITFEEMREMLGREKEVDESRLYTNMFNDLAYTSQSGANSGENDDKPENQHGKQDSPGNPDRSKEDKGSRKVDIIESRELTKPDKVVTLQESLGIQAMKEDIELIWKNARRDIVLFLDEGKSVEFILAFSTKTVKGLIQNKINNFANKALLHGYEKGLNELGASSNSRHMADYFRINSSKHIGSFNRLIDDTERKIKEAMESENPIAVINHTIQANKYRIGFIAKKIAYESYNYGVALAGKDNGLSKAFIDRHEGSCNLCKNSDDTIVLNEGWSVKIPPHHINCECEVTLINKEVV